MKVEVEFKPDDSREEIGARAIAAASDAIHAVGTSEGAKKGWAKRIGGLTADQHMDRFSHFSNVANLRHAPSLRDVYNSMADAHNKTALAIKTDHPQDHYKAAVAHQEAAYSAKLIGDLAAKKDHEKFSDAHDERGEALDPEGKHAHATDAVSTDIVHCRASSASGHTLGASKPWSPSERVEFMWMPAGISTITAGFRKGSIELTVRCDETTASAVQASLDAWREERPKQEPFGCVEHREHEASVRVSAAGGFSWRNDGVYLAAEPTTLGAQNVNGRVHRSWSPSFTTDADYASATEDGGVLRFPPGVRGSRQNPAQITGVDFCVGTLTNKPAFREMSPVKSSEAVTATWSDAAREAALAARRRAAEMSRDAYNESSKLPDDANPEDHTKAAQAHNKASKAHDEVATKLRHSGDSAAINYHKGMSAIHQSQAAGHKAGQHMPITVKSSEGTLVTLADWTQTLYRPGEAGEPVTASGTSEGAKKGWEHRGSYEGGKVNVYHKVFEDPRFGAIHRVVVDDGEPETRIRGFHSEEEAMKHAEDYIKDAGYKKDSAKATDATPSTTLRASCSAAFYQDVPDGTDAELKSYEDMVESGHNHAEAVECIRMDRNKAKRETPTLASIQERQSNAVAAANRIAEERGVAKLTAEDVYEKFSVNAEPRKQEPDATPEAILERIYARAGANR